MLIKSHLKVVADKLLKLEKKLSDPVYVKEVDQIEQEISNLVEKILSTWGIEAMLQVDEYIQTFL